MGSRVVAIRSFSTAGEPNASSLRYRPVFTIAGIRIQDPRNRRSRWIGIRLQDGSEYATGPVSSIRTPSGGSFLRYRNHPITLLLSVKPLRVARQRRGLPVGINQEET